MALGLLETGRQVAAVLVWLAGVVAGVWGFFRRAHAARAWVLRKWRDAIGAAVREQLDYRNDGESMRDQLDRMELHQGEIRKELLGIHDRINMGNGERSTAVRRLHERIDSVLEVIASKD